MRVLVLDDSDVMRKILIKHLLSLGLQESEIVEAHNGAEALRKLNSYTFDLLILDIVMEGVDGIAVFKEARQIQPNARIVMCSSFGEANTVIDLVNMGIDDFILKPFSQERVVETLSRNIVAAGTGKKRKK
ncbi:MAG: response regulator [Sporomusaceae bacterium]|nr:response regulator [Sporomusaceae bacterium]